MFVCIHYNRNATQIKKYVEMNIFHILYRLIQQKFLYLIQWRQTQKYFLIYYNLLQLHLQYMMLACIVYYVTNLYLSLDLSFLYLHLNALDPRSGIIYSS